MINQAFAEQFIRRIRSQTDYNINIMNEHGIIIASCSEERVGTFHATAFRMITNNISINVTEDLTEDLPGVTSPGVNLLLRENLIPVGVIGVSGDPSTVMSLAKLIKLSFESLYDYELQREFLPTASTGAMSHLARLLFVDRPVNIMRIRSQAAELGITEHVNRYPLLIEYVGCESSELVLSRFAEDYPNSPSHSPNDLLFCIGGNLLLLFKQIDETTVATYRNQIRLCIEEIDAWFESQVPGQKSRYICGTVQNRFSYYGRIYEDIMWLYRYRQKKELKVYFLADYLTEYMMSQISTETMAPLLDIYVRLIREHMDESIFRETIGALIETSMNLSEAAELLYLHKNTVAARVKKIKELLGISPLTSIRDAIFMTAIYNYLNMVYHIVSSPCPAGISSRGTLAAGSIKPVGIQGFRRVLCRREEI